jgi:exosortase E/protease (VPEID-CTERM system)
MSTRSPGSDPRRARAMAESSPAISLVRNPFWSHDLSSLSEPLAAWRTEALLPYRRWVALIVLLLAEVVLLTVYFDRNSIPSEWGLWSKWLGQSSQLARAAIAASVATVVFGSARLRIVLLGCLDGSDQPRQRLWQPLLAHLVAIVLFASVTTLVFSRVLHESAYPGVWAIAWFSTGLIALATWAAVAIEPKLWWPLVRGGSGAIAVGVAVGFVAWGLGHLTDQFWKPLAHSTLVLVHALLQLVCGNPVYRPEEFVVGTPAFQVHIAPQCSGYEGIGLVWAFLAAYCWLSRRSLRFPQAWLLFPLGTAFIWLFNVVRIAALVAVGTWVSTDIAVGGFHSQAGWLIFNAVALGLVLLSRRARFFAKVDPAGDRDAAENPAASYLAPLLSIVAVTMITAAVTVGFDVYYPIRFLAAAGTLYYFRGAYAGMWRIPSWQSIAVGTAIFVVWMALEPVHLHDGASSPLAMGLAQMPAAWAITWLAFRVLGSVITVPIAEELAFRGFLIRRLVASNVTTVPPGRFTWASFLISSLLFGALHGRWLAGTLAGMAYALTYYRRGELVDAIAAHATTNALIAAFVLVTGSWSLWS